MQLFKMININALSAVRLVKYLITAQL